MAVKSKSVENGNADVTPEVAVLSVGDVRMELTLAEVFKLRSGLRRARKAEKIEGRNATARRINNLKERLAPIALALGGDNDYLHEEAERASE